MTDYYFKHQHEGKGVLLKGVKKILERLKSQSIPIGLLTGNVESIGWNKLERANIRDYFSFGGFGSLAYRRVDLIPIAKAEAERVLKRSISLKDLFLVGDSPLDIACAKFWGIKAVAVAQGKFSQKELSIAGADLVLGSLEDNKKFFEFIE